MGISMIDLQRHILLQTIRDTAGRDQWKVLVVDETSRKLIENVAREDDILNENVTNIEQIEARRQVNSSTDAVYLLSPLPHIVECLKADLRKKRYRSFHLIWTSELPVQLKQAMFEGGERSQRIADSRSLDIDFFPRESHLITFREPWSFHALFHPGCDSIVKRHLDSLTRKIVSVCVSLGEYPIIKYYRPTAAKHEAAVLCSHLASFVQDALDTYARNNSTTFPTQSNRQRAVLIITDRTMDLMTPLVHEFTYQAMALDLLPVRDEDRLMYRNVIKRGLPDQEEKEVELGEKDKIWVANRHMHMKDLLGKIVDDFNKFRAENPQFAEEDPATTSVNTIKDMLAGLPQFQEGKEAFSLHLDMAEKCVKIFQDHKLLDIGSVEQSLATSLDEDYRKPKNLADQLVRLLDDDSVIHEDRLRLLIMYILYRNGILGADIEKLRLHGQLSPMDGEIISNLDLLGARTERQLKDNSPPPPALFPFKPPASQQPDEVSLSRFEPALRSMLEEQCQGTLDSTVFPPVKPHLSGPQDLPNISQTSLRSVNKPTWARPQPKSHEPRQRIIVFMAGGATYAEARACYEISHSMSKEVFLATSHMTTPKLFLRQVGELSSGRKQLRLPLDQPPPQTPAWAGERERAPSQPQSAPRTGLQSQVRPSDRPAKPQSTAPPTAAVGALNLSSRSEGSKKPNGSFQPREPVDDGKAKKDKKEKKQFGLFKKH